MKNISVLTTLFSKIRSCLFPIERGSIAAPTLSSPSRKQICGILGYRRKKKAVFFLTMTSKIALYDRGRFGRGEISKSIIEL